MKKKNQRHICQNRSPQHPSQSIREILARFVSTRRIRTGQSRPEPIAQNQLSSSQQGIRQPQHEYNPQTLSNQLGELEPMVQNEFNSSQQNHSQLSSNNNRLDRLDQIIAQQSILIQQNSLALQNSQNIINRLDRLEQIIAQQTIIIQQNSRVLHNPQNLSNRFDQIEPNINQRSNLIPQNTRPNPREVDSQCVNNQLGLIEPIIENQLSSSQQHHRQLSSNNNRLDRLDQIIAQQSILIEQNSRALHNPQNLSNRFDRFEETIAQFMNSNFASWLGRSNGISTEELEIRLFQLKYNNTN
ncbi:unnamed protein product, partial [Brachionus calyciflorus]